MKGKIKNLWEKIKYTSLFILTVAIYVALFVGMAWYCVDIGFGVGVFVSGCAIVTGIPIVIAKNIVDNVKQEVESRNLKKEWLNDLLKSLEEQQEYTTQEVEVVQNIESQNDNNLYVEEHISWNDKTLEILKETIEKDNENSFNRATVLETIEEINDNGEDLIRLRTKRKTTNKD